MLYRRFNSQIRTTDNQITILYLLIFNLSQLKKNADYLKMNSQSPNKIIASDIFTQQLTHQTIKTRFFVLEMTDLGDVDADTAIKIPISALKKYVFPGVIREFLQRNPYF